jgi:branched-chain amino acid transport system ATP-binding protein
MLSRGYTADQGKFVLRRMKCRSSTTQDRRDQDHERFRIFVFSAMTTLENVMVARHIKTSSGFLTCSLKLPSSRRDEKLIREKSMEFLDFVGLSDKAHIDALSMPFGLQRHLEIARALALEPKVILLDEPAGGLNPGETESLARLIHKIRDRNVTVVLMRHDMSLIIDISDHIIVLSTGRK